MFTGIVLWIGPNSIMNSLHQCQYSYILAAFSLIFVKNLIRFSKFIFSLHQYYSNIDILNIYLISKVSGNLSPARIGEFVPLLKKNFRKKEVAYFLFLDRFNEIFSTCLLGVLGSILYLSRSQYDKLKVVVLIGAITFLCAVMSYRIIMFIVIKKIKKLKNQGKYRIFLNKMIRGLNLFRKSIKYFKQYFFLVFLISVLATSVDFIAVKILFFGFGVNVPVSYIAFVWFISSIVAILSFIPNGLGVADVSTTLLYVKYGIEKGIMGGIVIFQQLFVLSNTLFLFAIHLFIRKKTNLKI